MTPTNADVASVLTVLRGYGVGVTAMAWNYCADDGSRFDPELSLTVQVAHGRPFELWVRRDVDGVGIFDAEGTDVTFRPEHVPELHDVGFAPGQLAALFGVLVDAFEADADVSVRHAWDVALHRLLDLCGVVHAPVPGELPPPPAPIRTTQYVSTGRGLYGAFSPHIW